MAKELTPMDEDNHRRNLPKDMAIQSRGEFFNIHATITSQHELEAVVWAMRLFNSSLPSTRKATLADFGIAEPPAPTYADELLIAGVASHD